VAHRAIQRACHCRCTPMRCSANGSAALESWLQRD